jgi:hypothetical protein
VADTKLAEQMRDWQPQCEYFIGFADNNVRIAKFIDGRPQLLPNVVPAAAAAQIATRLFPSGKCTEPVVVAGLDQGWLWSTLYNLEIHTPAAPGHTPPLYFLTPDLEKLWIVLTCTTGKTCDRCAHLLFPARTRCRGRSSTWRTTCTCRSRSCRSP